MNKVYARINWENYPSENTPLNESNLNKIDYGLNEVDNRVIELDTTKVSSASLSDNIKSWSMDETTGVITIEKYSGEKVLFDLNIEKIPVSFTLSEDGILAMTTDDGTQFTADIGSMIPVLTFEDSDTIAVSVTGTGVNKTYSFSIKNGSVTGDMLEENYLANINVKVAEAEGYANTSGANATASGNSATLSESWAVGGTGSRECEETNNAKYWAERAQEVSNVDIATTSKAGLVKPDGETITVDEDGTIRGNTGTINYAELENKPSVNGVELSGNKTAEELGITIISEARGIIFDDTEAQIGASNVQKAIEELKKIVSSDDDLKLWLQAGNITTAYSSLDKVFADELTVRQLMTIHASCDYLVEWSSKDNSIIDTFCSNAIAMKWIGLRDYICDKLMAIEVWKNALLGSEHWEYILKDHVPVMTSNTAPWGECLSSSVKSGNKYYPFDNDQSTALSFTTDGATNEWVAYKFSNPIKVDKVIGFFGFTTSFNIAIEYSNDGTNWTQANEIYSGNMVVNTEQVFDCSESVYAFYWRLRYVSLGNTTNGGIYSLQFYGRSLNVSVPTMTSNTAPYGECFASSTMSGYSPYMAFDNDVTTVSSQWADTGLDSGKEVTIGYKFTRPTCVKKFVFYAGNPRVSSITLQGSNDGNTWDDLKSITDIPASTVYKYVDVPNENCYLQYRFKMIKSKVTAYWISLINFYGVDYSEREFAEGSTMKYIYDHGVEFMTITPIKSNDSVTLTKNVDNLLINRIGTSAVNAGFYSDSIDFSKYSLIRAIIKENAYYENSNGGICSIGVSDGTSSDTDSVAHITLTGSDLPYNKSLDVKSITESKVATIGIRTSSSYLSKTDINEWWLE